MTLTDVARRVGVQPATLRRWVSRGLIPQYDGEWSPSAIGTARVVARMRERGHSLAEIKRATDQGRLAFGFLEDLFGPEPEVRLSHLYVHEPLVRSGATGVETAEQMHSLSREILPLAGPVLDQIHQRYLQHFVEQDVVGHMESDLEGAAVDLGRMRVAIAFADLAGYTRLTEEEGELTALDAVEIFIARPRDGST